MAMVEKMDAEDVEAKSKQRRQTNENLDSRNLARSADALYGELLESRVLLQSLSKSIESLHGPSASAVNSLRQTLHAFLQIRTKTQGSAYNNEISWENIDEWHEQRRQGWEAAMEAWRKRTQLGAAVARLSAVNVGPFQSARNALNDSERMRKRRHPKNPDDSLDFERYDDTPFYRTQLKELLESRPRKKKNNSNAFQAEVYDLALAHFSNGENKSTLQSRSRLLASSSIQTHTKKKKHHRESKGRTLKFEAHDKIKHFMFPVPPPKPPVDVQLLIQSLFQG
uniref:Apoptosis-antagonizing transcription factor C-terminal domain-containing protein n=1 Tax=Aureoumbra lagunensis TaxID=44058 RepID=A0A7S3K5K0_9STRA